MINQMLVIPELARSSNVGSNVGWNVGSKVGSNVSWNVGSRVLRRGRGSGGVCGLATQRAEEVEMKDVDGKARNFIRGNS